MKINEIIVENRLLNQPTPTVDQLAKKHKVNKKHILDQLSKGINVELEHTKDKKVAREIALDHLGEDPNYYTKLSKIHLESASGYIPNEKEKNDPRYKTALTVDIKPNTLKKNAQKLGSKISRAGIPPTLQPSGKFESVDLKFNSIELTPNQFRPYAIEFYDKNNIDFHHSKFLSNLTSMSKSNLTESKEFEDITSFINGVATVDSKKNIKVGDDFAVLSFEIRYFHEEIDVRGFTKPLKVVDIKMNSNGEINYIRFENGDRFPRLIKATVNKRPIELAAYFSDENQAKKALTYLRLLVPDNWEFDVSGINAPVDRNGLLEN